MNMRMTKLFIALIILVTPFYACQQFLASGGTEVIKIVGVDSIGGLILKDSADKPAKIFEAAPGANIKWQIKTDAVRKIVNIYKKTSIQSDDIFSTGPEKIFFSKSWKARVDPAAKDTQYIEYNIKWKDGADSIHIYDPRIQVKS